MPPLYSDAGMWRCQRQKRLSCSTDQGLTGNDDCGNFQRFSKIGQIDWSYKQRKCMNGITVQDSLSSIPFLFKLL